MAVINDPGIIPEIFTFGIKYRTQISTSNISGITQTVEIPGARWHGSMTFSNMLPAESAVLKAWLLELRGSAGRFYFNDITHNQAFNTLIGSPTIESGSTRSDIRVTFDSGSGAPSVGDYLSIGGANERRELKMIISVDDLTGNQYDLGIEPPIRQEVFIGDSVDYTNPLGVFILTSDDQAKWTTRSKALLSDITIDFMEMFVLA